MGEKGNVAADVASAGFVERAADAGSAIAGKAADKAVDVGLDAGVAKAQQGRGDDPPAEGWWKASDGKWYPPQEDSTGP